MSTDWGKMLIPPFYYGHASMNSEKNKCGATWPPAKERSDMPIPEDDKIKMKEKGIGVKNDRKYTNRKKEKLGLLIKIRNHR